ERACDTDVAKGMDAEQRKQYVLTILDTLGRSSAEGYGVRAALRGAADNKTDMKERLLLIIKETHYSGKARKGALLITVEMLLLGLCMASLTYFPVEAAFDKPDQWGMQGKEFVPDSPESASTPDAAPNPTALPDEATTAPTELTDSAPESYLWPIGTGSGYIACKFQEYPGHTGIDIAGPKGDSVLVTADGKVVVAKQTTVGYGNYLIIDHGGGIQSLYAHCQDLHVKVGDTVSAGQVIATRGRSGNSTGAQLHFEIRQNGEVVDPLDYVTEP
ncbi:M23 family metallopeptidase, partial [Ruminococcaceae bacterium OttesenSCG-928-L11]|nr:M23 family metallopeptidase [Ruminococcaceae bacterium OttesenSCG-928-L11]